MIKKIFYSLFLLSTVSCSQFLSQRSYLAEMENNGSSFFNPQDDFPVVGGDTGRVGETAQERKRRTPLSENSQDRRFLKQELKRLEAKESDDELAFYEGQKRLLSTTSEKIYYLKLSPSERREYLASRGFISPERALASKHGERSGSGQSDISSGMSKTDVVNSWGEPVRVEVAGNPSFENERWLYKLHGASKYIYFESGRVEGWE